MDGEQERIGSVQSTTCRGTVGSTTVSQLTGRGSLEGTGTRLRKATPIFGKVTHVLSLRKAKVNLWTAPSAYCRAGPQVHRSRLQWTVVDAGPSMSAKQTLSIACVSVDVSRSLPAGPLHRRNDYPSDVHKRFSATLGQPSVIVQLATDSGKILNTPSCGLSRGCPLRSLVPRNCEWVASRTLEARLGDLSPQPTQGS